MAPTTPQIEPLVQASSRTQGNTIKLMLNGGAGAHNDGLPDSDEPDDDDDDDLINNSDEEEDQDAVDMEDENGESSLSDRHSSSADLRQKREYVVYVQDPPTAPQPRPNLVKPINSSDLQLNKSRDTFKQPLPPPSKKEPEADSYPYKRAPQPVAPVQLMNVQSLVH
jgi:hypothetical protein